MSHDVLRRSLHRTDRLISLGEALRTMVRTVLVALTAAAMSIVGSAQAAIVDQPMTGATAPGWVYSGTAVLTGNGITDPVGDGWLRLTTNAGNQGGYAFYDTAFDISQGVVIQFDYATWGGSGADGYSIFLFNGAINSATFQLGGVGGSLGYSQRNIAPTSTGLNGGYIGVGVDEWGNFQNPTEGRVGGPGFRPNSVAVRGPQSTNYAYTGGTAANIGTLWFNQPTRPLQTTLQYRKVVIYLTPVPAPNYLRIDVYLQYGYNQPLTQVLNGLMVGQPIPASVKVGYAASTGGSTNYHEIRNLLINPLSTDINLAIFKTASVAAISVGSPITYTVTARNYGPNIATATNAPINDSIPGQITGVTWTCAGSGGGTCGNASGSGNTINTTATLPFNSAVVYTINGTLTAAPPTSTLSNTATIGVPAGVTDYNLADNTSTVSVLVNSDLSTSTKTVLDQNGGDANPGDVLRYTIKLNETAGGNATGVTVIDNIPANVTGFTVVSYPAGATNSSTGAGTGANGTGYLNVTNITVPANGSVTIVFDVTVGAVAPGTLINNTAAVTPLAGTGATPAAPTVIVSESSIPQNGIKPLYLYGAPGYQLSRTQTPGIPAFISINPGTSQVWTETPVLQSNVTIDPAINLNVPVSLYLASSANGNRNVRVDLQCSSGGTTLTQTQTLALRTAPPGPDPFTFNLPLAAPLTCTAGNSWRLTVANTSGGVRTVNVYPVSGVNISRAVLPSQNVINVDSVQILNAAYPGGSAIVTTPTGTTVYIRSVISDPFGSYDITSASIIITDPTSSVRVNGAAMTQVADSGAATKTYEYAYAIPAGGPAGNWTVRVTGTEGTEGTVTDLAQTALNVFIPMPSITAVKAVSTFSDPYNNTTNPKSIPGAVMLYTITVINSGLGPVDTDGMTITDPVPANTSMCVSALCSNPPVAFTCSVVPACGLTYNYATAVAYTNRAGGVGPYDYTPAPDASGYDAAVTGFQVRPSGAFSGVGGPPYSQLTIQFRVKVR